MRPTTGITKAEQHTFSTIDIDSHKIHRSAPGERRILGRASFDSFMPVLQQCMGAASGRPQLDALLDIAHHPLSSGTIRNSA